MPPLIRGSYYQSLTADGANRTLAASGKSLHPNRASETGLFGVPRREIVVNDAARGILHRGSAATSGWSVAGRLQRKGRAPARLPAARPTKGFGPEFFPGAFLYLVESLRPGRSISSRWYESPRDTWAPTLGAGRRPGHGVTQVSAWLDFRPGSELGPALLGLRRPAGRAAGSGAAHLGHRP